MGLKFLVSLLVLCTSSIYGASLPYHDGYDYHFNQMGVHLDFKLKDQAKPMNGGKVYVELPISAIYKLIERTTDVFKPFLNPIQNQILDKCILGLGKILKIKTIKADITFNGEKVLDGIYDIAVDYTIVHNDGIEEKGTLMTQIIVENTLKTVKVLFQKRYNLITANKNIEVKIEYQPTKEASPLEGGNIKIVATRKSVPFFKVGGYIGLTNNAAKYEVVFKKFYIESALIFNEFGHLDISTDIIKALFNGKIFIDRINKLGFLNKIAFEAKAEKNTEEIFNIIFTTVETSPKLYIYFPYFLKNVLNIHDLKYLETKLEYVVSGYEHTIITSCNYKNMKHIVKITPTMVAYEFLVGQLTHMKHVEEFKIENTANTFLFGRKTTFHLHETSYLYKTLCHLYPNYACFKDMKTNFHLKIIDKTAKKADLSVSILKGTTKIFHFEFNNVQVPIKIILKVPYLNVEYQPSTKELVISIAGLSKMYLTMTPIGENKFEFSVDGEPLVQIVMGSKQIQIITLHKDIPAITAIITFKTFSIFENSIGIQILYKQIAHKILIGWNINKLAKAFMEVKMTGSGTNLLGDYELFHHLNWNIVDIKNFDLIWNGKALSTGLPYLNTPLMTNGQLAFNDFVVKMKMVEQYKTETYTLIFETDPFKIAVLPFFTYP
eukprot:GFUD01013203.1.p1 GENE.GFUD01013203.1~~GFUD01013203.1.p1  ORF type:complete len:672 (+),score=129.26 GFUD01013203.1:29-2017(+)